MLPTLSSTMRKRRGSVWPLGFKVREAQLAKIPYILVVGDREVQDEGVNVRLRSGENAGFHTVEDAAAMIRADSEEPFKRGGMSYSFS